AATNSPQVVTLTGSSVSPQVTLSPGSLTFGSQLVGTTSLAQTATLTNTSKGNVNNIVIAATGDFSQTNTCPSTLAGGASCPISVQFAPTTTGSRTGAVKVTDSAPNSPQVLSLSGSGIAL